MRNLALWTLLAASPAFAAEDGAFDPNSVGEVDAIECRLDAPTYNGFAMAIEGEEDIAGKRLWRKIESANPFMHEYELPAPITVAGSYSTRRIGLTSNAMVAILDLPDPAVIARTAQIEVAMTPEPMIDAMVASGKFSPEQAEAQIRFRKFLGERVITESTAPATGDESFGTHVIVARTISNATTHPDKTFYGCSYRIELLDKDGLPL